MGWGKQSQLQVKKSSFFFFKLGPDISTTSPNCCCFASSLPSHLPQATAAPNSHRTVLSFLQWMEVGARTYVRGGSLCYNAEKVEDATNLLSRGKKGYLSTKKRERRAE